MTDPQDHVSLPRYVRLDLAAEYLDISKRHVEKLVSAGELEGVNVALATQRRRLRVSVRSLRDFLERRGTKPLQKAPS